MKKKTLIIVATAIVISLGIGSALAQEAVPNQKLCPVMGSPINKDVFTDYNGMRIYFCCAGCDETFTSDPDTYLAKMKKAGVVLEKTPITQKNCPVTGEPIDKTVFTDYKGTRIYFCCQACVDTYLKEPEKYPLHL